MTLHRLLAEEELLRDLPSRPSLRDEREDVAFALGQDSVVTVDEVLLEQR